MDCYKKFAEVYDELIHSDIDYEKWAKTILKICDENLVHRKTYLDLACGTGNMTSQIGSNFSSVWGVDLSEEMLSEAETKLRNMGLKAKFICQDICELNLNKRFNLITCCLDSTNYIIEDEDVLEFFNSVHKHLEDDGIFIFDINSYYKLSEILGNNTYNHDSDDLVYIWENTFEEEIVDMYLTFFVKEGDVYRRFDEHHSERAYSEEKIESLLEDAKLSVIKKLDTYESNKICKKTERITYVVKKIK